MRLWTLHPRYLDRQGLTALWREALLAQAVLMGRTKGYRHHPQLRRFREHPDPLAAIAMYLAGIRAEACRREYRFDGRKIGRRRTTRKIAETRGQLFYEWAHLEKKLAGRSKASVAGGTPAKVGANLCGVGASLPLVSPPDKLSPHPLFRIVPGRVRPWEKRKAQG